MLRLLNIKSFAWLAGVAATLVAGGMFIVSGAQAQNKEPIKIGFGHVAHWLLSAERQAGAARRGDLAKKKQSQGGLLGRQVQLVYYDDKSSRPPKRRASTPSCSTSTKSISWSSAPMPAIQVAPAMPVVIRKGKIFVSPVRARRERQV